MRGGALLGADLCRSGVHIRSGAGMDARTEVRLSRLIIKVGWSRVETQQTKGLSLDGDGIALVNRRRSAAVPTESDPLLFFPQQASATSCALVLFALQERLPAASSFLLSDVRSMSECTPACFRGSAEGKSRWCSGGAQRPLRSCRVCSLNLHLRSLNEKQSASRLCVRLCFTHSKRATLPTSGAKPWAESWSRLLIGGQHLGRNGQRSEDGNGIDYDLVRHGLGL